MHPLTRRRFLEESMLATAAAAAGAVAPGSLHGADANPAGSPNNRLHVAIIGGRIRGTQHAQELAHIPDCIISYVCDPDRDVAAELAAKVTRQQGRAPKVVQDMRRIFENEAIDAVFIAAPNHWHALAAIWAMDADKDVYVEKPVSHNISEGRRIVEVSRKTHRVCQGGTQNRSNGALAAAIEYMRDGKLGEVKVARSIVYGPRGSIGGPGRFEVPPSVDYDLWCGPAPMSPLTRPHLHYDWHWVWETGNGELGNNNIHSLDICRWGLGVTGLSRTAISYGGRFGYVDAGQTPNTQVVIFDFGDKTIISETRGLKTAPYRPDFKGGWIFEGTKGFIAGTSLFDLEGRLVRTFEGRTESHFANFLNATRTRKRADQTADIAEGHQSTALCHMGNISWRLGSQVSVPELRQELAKAKIHHAAMETLDRTVQHLRENEINLEKTKMTLGVLLEADGERERFLHNPAANALLTREYRDPFVVPARV